MEADQFAEACPLLEQSYELDPRAGTLFTLANCRDREGRIASASARYGEYLRMYANMSEVEQTKHQSRSVIAETRVRELETELPLLKIVWQGELPANVKVHVDDFELPQRAPSLPLPLDPGPHGIIIEQPQAPKVQRSVTLSLGQTTTFDLDAEVVLVKPVELVPITPKPKKEVFLQPLVAPQKKVGFIVLGGGGASLLFGAIMGAAAINKKQIVDLHCPEAGGYGCDATGLAAVNDLRTYANSSTAGIAVGVALATVGVVLIVTAPKRARENPNTITWRATNLQGGGWIGLGGTF